MFKIIGGDGKEYGPVTADQIRDWLAAGRANFDTQVRSVDNESWGRLGDRPEFAGTVPPPLAGAAGTAALAGRWARLGAAAIDFIATCACFVPAFLVIVRIVMENGMSRGSRLDPATLWGQQGMLTTIIAGAALLVIQVLLLSLRGQTLGKIATGIRIVRISDGKKAGFVHAVLLRAAILEAFYLLLGFVPFVGGLIALMIRLVDICFVFREDRRCIHDLIAGTRVIKVEA